MKSPRIASPRFVWAGLLSAMGVLCASARSEAACFLPRALALPAAMDANLRCDHDQDFNGLDDEMERLVAECLAPTLNFNSTHPSEIPNTTLFNVHLAPSEVRPGEIEVLVHYGLIWTRDEGHIAHNCQADAGECQGCCPKKSS